MDGDPIAIPRLIHNHTHRERRKRDRGRWRDSKREAGWRRSAARIGRMGMDWDYLTETGGIIFSRDLYEDVVSSAFP